MCLYLDRYARRKKEVGDEPPLLFPFFVFILAVVLIGFSFGCLVLISAFGFRLLLLGWFEFGLWLYFENRGNVEALNIIVPTVAQQGLRYSMNSNMALLPPLE